MASEFEKALVAIVSMSYGKRIDFAWELYKLHVVTGHDAQTCVFCVGMVEIRGVCDSCHNRFVSDDRIKQEYSCSSCGKNVMHCYRCINEHRNDDTCDGKLCKNCVMIHGVDAITCVDCKYHYSLCTDYSKHEFGDFDLYSYEEIMILAKKLKFEHEHNYAHDAQQCPFCDSPYAEQLVCSYCFQPDPNGIVQHHSETECLTCGEFIVICDDCNDTHGCDQCYMHDKIKKIYCVACYKTMPKIIQCKCKEYYNNEYVSMTKPCKT